MVVDRRQRYWIRIEGVVQGVGFRPFVHKLAAKHDLHGFARNDGRGLAIEVEGAPAALDAFVAEIRLRAPPLAQVERIEQGRGEPIGHRGFVIADSGTGEERALFVAADAATCAACLCELFDPLDRRYRYPFLNCTDCGPRLTIVEDLPYDRARTTMARFPMCAACRAEYEDPQDRRFHAQPVACPACGPHLVLEQSSGARVLTDDPIVSAVEALTKGRIVAIKGIGGYHLACDARDPGAVSLLRRRKHRPAKPLAVMVPGITVAHALCEIDAQEAKLLASVQRPIVLLRKRNPCGIAEEVAPGIPHLGILLPYTPLHHLIAAEAEGPLVLTSGNRSDEPVTYEDDEARARLGGIADLFLTHDRPIATRCDDSVARIAQGSEMLIRRSRGYAPQPIPLPRPTQSHVLALGGDLKNTFALARGGRAFLSPHIGDLGDALAYRELRRSIEHYSRLLGIRPEIVAHDLHPGYLSVRLASELDAAPVGVQHHHAHAAACMAEHGVAGPVLAVVFDGTGYGTDGAIWGGEFLIAGYDDFERIGHLGYVPLPGGDAAVREPWRAAAAHVIAACGTGSEPAEMLGAQVGEARWRVMERMLGSSAFSVPSSSVGRLFDAVAALIGLRHEVGFEAQAAMELEAVADRLETGCYPVEIAAADGSLVWYPGPIVAGVAADLGRRRPPAEIAGKFHNSVCQAIIETCRAVRRQRGPLPVVLTGGVFQNALLVERAATALDEAGFEVLTHCRVPTNDGGLCLGQAAIACAQARP